MRSNHLAASLLGLGFIALIAGNVTGSLLFLKIAFALAIWAIALLWKFSMN